MVKPVDSPALRLFALLEHIAGKSEFVSLHGLVEETGLPKPTVHRMLQQLESGEILVRQSDGRHYGIGVRVRRFAESVLLNATQHGARREVLRALMRATGETCSAATLSGAEVVLLDRVETLEPLRFHLAPGTRVPAHCSASGKAILGQLTATQRSRLLSHAPLVPVTALTVTDLGQLEEQILRASSAGYATCSGEYLAGLMAIAVIVPANGRSNMAIELEVPASRLGAEGLEAFVAPLREAALALSMVEAEGSSD